jgi:hypothetical protein
MNDSNTVTGEFQRLKQITIIDLERKEVILLVRRKQGIIDYYDGRMLMYVILARNKLPALLSCATTIEIVQVRKRFYSRIDTASVPAVTVRDRSTFLSEDR